MSSIVIAGDTSGSVTLQAPAVAGSTILTLPATSGTIQASGAGYTTNGVAFASSTSVLATGSALTFDGTNVFKVLAATGIAYNRAESTQHSTFVQHFATSGGTGVEYKTLYRFVDTDVGELMRLNSTGLAIGTTSATAKLTVINTADANKQVVFGDSATYYGSVGHNSGTGLNEYRTETGGGHAFYRGTSGTADLTLNSSGNLGIGTTSPTAKLDVTSGDGGDTSDAFVVRGATGAFVVYPHFDATLGCLINSFNTAFSAYKPMTFQASSFVFNPNGTERARIDSSGNLMVGTTSAVTGARLSSVADSGSQAASFKSDASTAVTILNLWGNETSGNQIFTRFATDSNAERGSITYNRAGGLVAYNTTSDYRAKDISGSVTGSGALIDSIPVYMGTMKGATQERPMFIAHEVPAYAHTGEKDAVDKDGNPVYQQMDASALIPVMWAEIQSLRQRLAVLEGA